MYCKHCPYSFGEYSSDINYWYCEKVGGNHVCFGYCDDNLKQNSKRNNIIKSNTQKKYIRSQRRYNTMLKQKRLKAIVKQNNNYKPSRGYFKCEYDEILHKWIYQDYIIYPKNSNKQRFYKKQASHRVRHSKDILNHGGYKKQYEYNWNID